MSADLDKLWELARAQAEEFGASLEGRAEDFKAFAQEQAGLLADVAADVGPASPAFRRASKSAANRLTARAIGAAYDSADEVDERLQGMFIGILTTLAAL